jgi:site-specific recombinase XerC
MLLGLAERRPGIADRLAAEITDRRDRTRVVHALSDILRARILAIACGYEDAYARAYALRKYGRVSVDALQYIMREAGRLAKLDVEAHPHMLRHATGYMLANEGTDTRLIQAFLGHADIRHTAHYTALSPKRLATVRVR